MARRKKKTDAPAAPENPACETAEERNAIDGGINHLFSYIGHVLTPRHLACERRRMGDPTISPKDYFCMCPVDQDDLLPVCRRYAPKCRFRHRPAPPQIRSPRQYLNNSVRFATTRKIYRSLVARAKESDAGRAAFEQIIDDALNWRRPGSGA